MAIVLIFVGVILLFSGAMPVQHHRIALIEGVVHLWVVEPAHLLGTVSGVGLVFLTHSRLAATYRLSVILLALGIVAALLKGLDYVEALMLAIILTMLLVARPEFQRKGSPFAFGLNRKASIRSEPVQAPPGVLETVAPQNQRSLARARLSQDCKIYAFTNSPRTPSIGPIAHRTLLAIKPQPAPSLNRSCKTQVLRTDVSTGSHATRSESDIAGSSSSTAITSDHRRAPRPARVHATHLVEAGRKAPWVPSSPGAKGRGVSAGDRRCR